MDGTIADSSELGLFSPIALPCGRILHNRLVKVALYEHLADLHGGPPNSYHNAVYSKWAKGGWGMILTGNVQISKQHLSLGRDITIPQVITEATLEPFKALAAAMHKLPPVNGASSEDGPLAIMQLSHGGRQSPNLLGGRWPFASPFGPSAIRVGSSAQSSGLIGNAFFRFLFQTPKPLSLDGIAEVIAAFVRGARVAMQSGFDGIQLHAAHGYLLAQFLSPKSNARTDEYSCDNALQLIRRIVDSIRAEVPASFVIGIKLNVADYVDTSCKSPADRALGHIANIAQWGSVDFVELSGGDHEDAAFMDKPQASASSYSPRQALFVRCAHDVMQTVVNVQRAGQPKVPLILLTGGFRAPAQMHAALVAQHADLIGVGRTAVLCPDLPETLRRAGRDLVSDMEPMCRQPAVETKAVKPKNPVTGWLWSCLPKVKLIGSGVEVAWYELAIRRVAEAVLSNPSGEGVPSFGFDFGSTRTLAGMWLWRAPRAS